MRAHNPIFPRIDTADRRRNSDARRPTLIALTAECSRCSRERRPSIASRSHRTLSAWSRAQAAPSIVVVDSVDRRPRCEPDPQRVYRERGAQSRDRGVWSGVRSRECRVRRAPWTVAYRVESLCSSQHNSPVNNPHVGQGLQRADETATSRPIPSRPDQNRASLGVVQTQESLSSSPHFEQQSLSSLTLMELV